MCGLRERMPIVDGAGNVIDPTPCKVAESAWVDVD
jgi:hypothetical protein